MSEKEKAGSEMFIVSRGTRSSRSAGVTLILLRRIADNLLQRGECVIALRLYAMRKCSLGSAESADDAAQTNLQK